MHRPTPRLALAGAALIALTLSGCSSNSSGGNSPGTTSSTSAGTSSGSASPAASPSSSPSSQAAGGCTPQTSNVSLDSAAQILQTVAKELPSACGFTVSGYLDGGSELPDGLQLQGQATADASGSVHVAIIDQGVEIDTYKISGTGDYYVRIFEADAPNAAPDVNVEGAWGSALTTAQITAAGTKYIKLTSTQASTWQNAGMGSKDVLFSAGALGSDLSSGSTGWKLSGTKTVDGVQCVQVQAPAAQDAPTTTISVDAATGLPIQVAYATSQPTTPTVLTFSAYGTTPTVTPPSNVVDGSTLG